MGAAEPALPWSHKTLKYALKYADFAAALNPGLVPARLKLQRDQKIGAAIIMVGGN